MEKSNNQRGNRRLNRGRYRHRNGYRGGKRRGFTKNKNEEKGIFSKILNFFWIIIQAILGIFGIKFKAAKKPKRRYNRINFADWKPPQATAEQNIEVMDNKSETIEVMDSKRETIEVMDKRETILYDSGTGEIYRTFLANLDVKEA
ncbi:uncharacterized protein J8A68_003636 [[Candida] subhashii]|uniref:Uncharacterized protein n=1 Tax=[Candida] subhashii TaxID=561895 RepID=A0A8J5ULL0_9ASCO|nr:uncharacterized protein J8A68_003636 [[Candida] subhashii]KAG7662866.1 hypothetical protein J8A68_003636 [[Candida] subhashii]